MKEIIKRPETLPDTIEALKKFIDFNEERLNAFLAKMRAINKVAEPSKAKILFDKTYEEAIDVGVQIIDAEARLGEILYDMAERGERVTDGLKKGPGFSQKTRETLKDLGITKTQSARAQMLRLTEGKYFDVKMEFVEKAIKRKEIPRRTEIYNHIMKLEREIIKAERLRPIQPIIYPEDKTKFLNRFDDKSVDLLLTDPPYMTEFKSKGEFEKFANGWVPLAVSKVKDTGRIYIFTGNYPEELHAYLLILLNQNNFVLSNILIWGYFNTIGPSPKMGYKQSWNAVFYLYGKGASELNPSEKRERNLVEKFDTQIISAPDGRHEIRYSPFQKPEEIARRFIWHSTKEADLMVDPFAGTGTFLLVAGELGRKALGAENDKKMIEICKKRGLFIYER